MKPTYKECAESWSLWSQYVDTCGSEDNFNRLSVEDRIALIEECFGPEYSYRVQLAGQTYSNSTSEAKAMQDYERASRIGPTILYRFDQNGDADRWIEHWCPCFPRDCPVCG